MADKEKVEQAIYNAVDNLNLQLATDQKLEKSSETVLIGENGRLDSLGLVNFIVALEQEIEEQFNLSLMLFNESLITSDNSPLSTIGTLAEYITDRVS